MERSQSSSPLWLAVLLVGLPVLYVLSFGPAVWLDEHSLIPEAMYSPIVIFYWPLTWAITSDESPRWLLDGIFWYLGFWG